MTSSPVGDLKDIKCIRCGQNYGNTIDNKLPQDICIHCGLTGLKRAIKENIQENIEKIQKEFSRANKEFAKQIFDDIENWLSQDGEEDWMAWDSQYLDKYFELKKKYLGDEDNN